ncbi:hypothetical protein ACLOJK_034314 [Asimina triloba]
MAGEHLQDLDDWPRAVADGSPLLFITRRRSQQETASSILIQIWAMATTHQHHRGSRRCPSAAPIRVAARAPTSNPSGSRRPPSRLNPSSSPGNIPSNHDRPWQQFDPSDDRTHVWANPNHNNDRWPTRPAVNPNPPSDITSRSSSLDQRDRVKQEKPIQTQIPNNN